MGATKQLNDAQQDVVRRILKERADGIGQEAVAELIQISQQSVSKIIHGGGVSYATADKLGVAGWIRFPALLAGDLHGADPRNAAAEMISAADVARLGELAEELAALARRLRR